MDMLKWGATWLSTMVDLHTQQTVIVINNGVNTSIDATMVDEAGRHIPSTAGLVTEHTKFMFETGQVASSGLTFARNTIIEWNGQRYQVVLEANKFWTYNDVYKQQIVVTAKHVSD